jgi:SAM-dependent methyltransferase
MATAATSADPPKEALREEGAMDAAREQHTIDSSAWNVFANHQPYYHILSDPRMLNPGQSARDAFWATGTRDVQALMDFAGLSRTGGTCVDFGCGLGRLTRGLIPFTDRQVGLDISPVMIAKARELSSFASMDFRTIPPEGWPVDSASASLVISLLVFNHLSTIELMEESLKELARVLRPGGFAVFGIQTMTSRGAIAGWLQRLARRGQPDRAPNADEIRRKLVALDRGEQQEFSEQEIVGDMFGMEFRRLKSISLRRLRSALHTSRLDIRRMTRDRTDGSTRVAVQKA